MHSTVLLAPMSGYADMPFRLIVRRFGGAGLAYTEMLNPRSVLAGSGMKTRSMLASCREDAPLGCQLYGADPSLLADAARRLAEGGAVLVDINMGCPKRKITSKGMGAALLKDPGKAVKLARAVVEAVGVPVTVKIRVGWDRNDEAIPALAREFEQAGVAALAVHGRTGKQGYDTDPDFDAIRRVVEAVGRIPVIGNGDVECAASAREMFDRTGCSAVMVGRAALREPWCIRDIWRDLNGEPPLPAPSRQEQSKLMEDHFDETVALYGEHAGVLLFRKWIPFYARRLEVPNTDARSLLQVPDASRMRDEIGRISARA